MQVVVLNPRMGNNMVFVAEWFRRGFVGPVYVGSNPTEHPKQTGRLVCRQVLIGVVMKRRRWTNVANISI